MNEILREILTWGLGGGAFGSALTWLFARQYRDNDLLVKLQGSIDLLGEKYTQVLDENTKLKQEKAEWLVTQKQLIKKVERLTKEVMRLQQMIETPKDGNNETENSALSTHMDTSIM